MIPWQAPVATAPVRGHVVVPGSKSASARSLLLAALADGPSGLGGVLDSRDTSLMRTGLSALGAGVDDLPDGRVRVSPADPVTGGGTIDCGLAGTVLRFLPPVAALAAGPTRFTGDAAASSRPITGLLVRGLGVRWAIAVGGAATLAVATTAALALRHRRLLDGCCEAPVCLPDGPAPGDALGEAVEVGGGTAAGRPPEAPAEGRAGRD